MAKYAQGTGRALSGHRSLRLHTATYARIPADEVDAVLRAAKTDPVAKRRLIEHNIPLVLSLVRVGGFAARDMEDARQEGVLGVARAIDTFDPDKGFTFATYASYWIRSKLGLFRKALKDSPFLSLDEPSGVGDREDATPQVEYLASPVDPVHMLEDRDRARVLEAILERLSNPRDRDLVMRRLQGEQLQTIADVYGLSRERIRQIEVKLLGRPTVGEDGSKDGGARVGGKVSVILREILAGIRTGLPEPKKPTPKKRKRQRKAKKTTEPC